MFTSPNSQIMGEKMHILVTGGCGYIGSVLVPKLLALGHRVTVLDIMWFGNFLPEHKSLTVIKKDIRSIDELSIDRMDAVVHLANVANDPCGDLDSKLTWEINALATMRLVEWTIRGGAKQFVYASSGSVYGVKEEPDVTEDLSLLPISDYNKTKMISERVLLSYKDDILVQCIRPATVCGLSPPHASRCFREYADHAGPCQPENHRFRWRSDTTQHSCSGYHRRHASFS